MHQRESKLFADEEDFGETKTPEQDEVKSEAKTKQNFYVPHPDVLARYDWNHLNIS